MREWKEARGGIDVVVLTTDAEAPLLAAIEEHGLQDLRFERVDPTLWTDWGIAVPSRPEIPVPTTWVARGQRIIWQTQTGKYSSRVDASEVLSVIEAHQEGLSLVAGQAATSAEILPPTVEAVAGSKGVDLTVKIPDGAYTYGAKEKLARPLWVEVNGTEARAKIPKGPKLMGSFLVPVKTSANQGVLHYQLCTAGLCGPPSTLDWVLRKP